MPSTTEQKPIFIATANDLGQRVDNYLLKQCKHLNKSSCYKLIRKGQIRVNGKRVKALHKLSAGDQIRVPPFLYFVDRQPVTVPKTLQQQLLKHIIYEDADYLVLNKPAGIPCHTGTGHALGVIETLSSLATYADVQLAHRLDKDTSGCLLLAMHRPALLVFQQALQQHAVSKSYLAVLVGQLKAATTVNRALDTAHRINGIRHVVVSETGQSAETVFKPLKSNGQFTLSQCDISSGRTHQIRVHAQFMGHPVLGDRFYGKNYTNSDRQLFLHAHTLQFGTYSITAPLPEEFDAVLNKT